MQAKIRAAVVATNAVYAASKLTLRLRLVFMGESSSCPCYLPSADRMLPACTDQAHLSAARVELLLHLCRLRQWVHS